MKESKPAFATADIRFNKRFNSYLHIENTR